MSDSPTLDRMESGEVLKMDESGDITYLSLSTSLVLTARSLILYNSSDTNQSPTLTIDFANVIGSRSFVHDEKSSSSSYAPYLEMYCYSKNMCCTCCSDSSRVRTMYKLVFKSIHVCTNWSDSINYYCDSSKLTSRSRTTSINLDADSVNVKDINVNNNKAVIGGESEKRRYLVVLNPVSGTKQAQSIFDSIVKKMLDEASIEHVLLVTSHANHAYEYVSNYKVNKITDYSVIVTIGGDGLIYEVINGLSYADSISSIEDNVDLLSMIKLAPVPGGTGNGLVKSILFASNDEQFSPLNATFVAIKGISSPFDLSHVTTITSNSGDSITNNANTDNTLTSFLSLGWGLISDVDLSSESMRCLGELRLYIAAVYFISAKRSYQGSLHMLLVDGSDGPDGNSINLNTGMAAIHLPKLHEPFTAEKIQSLNNSNSNNVSCSMKKIEGEFILVWVVQTSHAAATMHSGPGIELDDGVFTIYVVRSMSRCELLQLLIDIDAGDHVKHDKVEVYKALAYRIEPEIQDNGPMGLYSLDGELVPYGRIQAAVAPACANIMKLV